MTQMTIQQAFEMAVQQHQAGRLGEAERIYRQILGQYPDHAEALHLLGVIAYQVGKYEAAGELMGRAIAAQPWFPEAYSNLGNVLRDLGRLEEATEAYRQAIKQKPDYAEAFNNLGSVLRDRGILAEAVAACQRAVELKPNYPQAYSNLGVALRDLGKLAEAVTAFKRAIELQPEYPEAFNNLGVALKEQGQLDAAVAAGRQALALQPRYAEACSNLGNVLKAQGQLAEALDCYRQALEFKPDFVAAASSMLYGELFHPGYDAGRIYQDLEAWEERFAGGGQEVKEAHGNERSPERRLRVGYVSADFRDHVIGRNIWPLLAGHDRARFEIFCYAQVSHPDALTERFKNVTGVGGWRNLVGVSDARAAELIRADGIDILVDLTLHLAGNRLLVFARKPAPVQVTFAGYPGSTGLSAMDYRLSDGYLDPVGDCAGEKIYAEETVRLPGSFWCYDPLECGDIPVNPLPALSAQVITFGCLNNFCKIHAGVLRVWAGVMRAVPGSRLMLLAPEGSHRERTWELLAREGVERGRVKFVPGGSRREYLELYHQIDIGLDSFPYNGHTTSLDSFWMGVPVVTLVEAESTVVGRAGLSQLMHLGLPELIARSPEEMVNIVVGLTGGGGDMGRLAALRGGLRGRMERSVLMDRAGFVRGIEGAYRAMWRKWCGMGG